MLRRKFQQLKVLNRYKESIVPKDILNNDNIDPDGVNPDWKKEIASYDTELIESNKAFREHHLVLEDIEKADLSDEEKIIFKLLLSGTSVEEIAKKVNTDIDAVNDVIEITRIKLVLDE